MGAKINKNFRVLQGNWVFGEVTKQKKAFMAAHPDVEVCDLGVGNTKLPLASVISRAMGMANGGLTKLSEGRLPLFMGELSNLIVEAGYHQYTGYGIEQGNPVLRRMIAEDYKRFGVDLDFDEIFVSDGAKCDVGNIQMLFSAKSIPSTQFADECTEVHSLTPVNRVALQDPAYPAYEASNVVAGRSGEFDEDKLQYEGMLYLPCTAENGFFPDLSDVDAELLYLCSPNNPTGAVASREQLTTAVDWARERKNIIIFDSAYGCFISEGGVPHSIYEIPGAKECAIEINSFSKSAGFTGVRLGYSVVPKELVCEDSGEEELNKMWSRRQATFFNGASNVSQAGGIAALTQQGRAECALINAKYMRNATILREGLMELGFETHGGVNAPYVWVKTPNGESSMDYFNTLLDEGVIVVPGSAFGPSGEGYFRCSAFATDDSAAKGALEIIAEMK